MNKFYLIVFMFFLVDSLLAQDKLLGVLPLKEGKVFYSDVILVDSVKKDELFIRSKEWFGKKFTSTNEVIQLDDKEAGKIIQNGIIKSELQFGPLNTSRVLVHFTFSVFAKDGKSKYEITNFKVQLIDLEGNVAPNKQPMEAMPGKDKNNIELFKKVDASINDLLKSLREYLTAEDNW